VTGPWCLGHVRTARQNGARRPPGRLSFGYFSLGGQRKVTRVQGGAPGTFAVGVFSLEKCPNNESRASPARPRARALFGRAKRAPAPQKRAPVGLRAIFRRRPDQLPDLKIPRSGSKGTVRRFGFSPKPQNRFFGSDGTGPAPRAFEKSCSNRLKGAPEPKKANTKDTNKKGEV
jgi:hypothetical protein